MNHRLLILCPGQGCQNSAMYDLARTDPQGAALLERVSPLLPDPSRPDRMFSKQLPSLRYE